MEGADSGGCIDDQVWRSTPSHLGSGKSSGRQSQPQTRRTGARPRWLLPAASMSTVSCASALSLLSERLSK